MAPDSRTGEVLLLRVGGDASRPDGVSGLTVRAVTEPR